VISLKEQERIITTLHRYCLTLVGWFVLVLILFAVDAFFMFWLFAHNWWGQTLFVLGILTGLFILVRTLFIWQKNVLLITTHRVIDIDQRGFFDKTVSEIPYDQIEDVSGRIKGFFGTILRYGDLTIQTGIGKVQIIAHYIKRPVQVQQDINERRERYLSRYSAQFSGDVAEAVIDKIYELEIGDLQKVWSVVQKQLIKLEKK